MIKFRLPFPPSVNNYWIQCGRRRVITEAARMFKHKTSHVLLKVRKDLSQELQLALMTKKLERRLWIYPKDKRRRDGTNLEKAVDDALVFGGLIKDDSQIVKWSGEMMPMDEEKWGYVIVELLIYE